MLARKTQNMSTNDAIAIWGCIINASVWAASSNQPMGFLWCAVWMCFAGVILYSSKRLA